MTGEEPESVYATASSFMGSDDTAVIVLKFPSGALCIIDNSRQTSYGYDVRAEVLGSRGMATLKNPLENTVVLSTEAGHSASSVRIHTFNRLFKTNKERKSNFSLFIFRHLILFLKDLLMLIEMN